MGKRQHDHGGIVTGWLIQMLVFMAVIGLIVYEIGAIGVTAVSLDDKSRDVAKAGASNYRDTQDLADATAAAQTRAESLEVEIIDELTVDEGDIVVTISKQSPTVLVHKIGFLEDLTRPSVTGRAPWDPR